MTSNQRRYFIEAAERQSFTAAAERLFLAQSTLSRQIMLLEEEFGTPFFLREKNGLVLTPAGKVFYEEAVKAERRERELREQLDRLSRSHAQLLRLAVLEESLPPRPLVEAVRALRVLRPEIDVEFRVLDVHNLYLEFENGSVDAVCSLRHNVEGVPGAVCLDLAREDMYLAAHQSIPLPRHDVLTAEDLARALEATEFLMLSPDLFGPQAEPALRELLRENVPPDSRRVRFLQSTSAIVMHVLCALGVTMVHRSHRLSTAPGVALRPLEGAAPVTISAAFRSGSANPALAPFLDLLREQMAQ